MSETIFITGGARRGKSRLAEELAARYGAPRGYLATAAAGDAEM
ncbi:MAG TPA: bifunctional adenosylcobinamide kinase/adenosylcobinamide-phosphate guanylyltransferase, partial [Geobacteraceae bacterium]